MAERLIPNQTALINAIPMLESRASSEIENIVTTGDELFRYAEQKGNHFPHEVKETLRYRTALYEGIKSIQNRPISISTICEICSIIREVDVKIRNLPGTTIANSITKEKIYTPPYDKEIINRLLQNWQEYIHANEGTDPLIKLAVQHYQFEAIHPFTDGNGLTGRIVNLLYLVDQGLLDSPILYLSRYFLRNKAQYYESLLKVTSKGAWHEWVLYILEGIRDTAQWTCQKIIAIDALIKETCSYVQEKTPQLYKKDFIELLFIQPYVRIHNLLEHRIAGRQTAAKYLQTLCELGLLEEMKIGRDKLFLNKRFLTLLLEN